MAPIRLPQRVSQVIQQIRFPFRWKITVPFIVLGAWLLLGGALIVSRIIFENAQERFHNRLLESSKIAAEWMVHEEDAQLEGLRALAFTVGVPEALRSGDAEKLRSLAYPVALNNALEAVEFLDLQGNLVFSMRRKPDSPPESYQFVQGGGPTFARLDFVKKALAAQADGRGDKYAGLASPARDVIFYVSGPVYDEAGARAGAILVGASAQAIAKRMQEQALAHITFYSIDGSLVTSAFPSASALEPGLAQEILTRQGTSSFTRPLTVLETDFVELVSPWKARGQDLGMLGVASSQPALVNPSIPTTISTFIFLLAAFVLIISIGLAIASYITRPLVRLTSASHEVSKGNLRIQVPPPPLNDELTDLTFTFNSMIDHLNQANAEILDAYDSTLEGWSKALEMREKETAFHGQRVTEMTVWLAKEMGVQGNDLVNLRRGAILHDIGKIGIPDAILNKPGPLTADEFAIMKMHPTYAWEYLSRIDFLRPALEIPYMHHEKWDGSGYPRGLRGEEIPLSARIFAIVDVWDAITNDRVYRKAMTRAEALEVIEHGRGTHFEPRVVDAFLTMLNTTQPAQYETADPSVQALFGKVNVLQAD